MKKYLRLSFIIVICISTLFSCTKQNVPPDNGLDKSDTEELETTSLSPEKLYEPFVPVLRFAVCSDVHVNNDTHCSEAERLRKLIDTVYNYSEADQFYPYFDALIVAGDLTVTGSVQEQRNYKSIITENLHDETTFIAMLGNHEHYGNYKAFPMIVGQPPKSHVVIKGYHFISVSPDIDSNEYGDEVKEFLETEVASAAADGPDKPIFAFQHHNLRNTVYGSEDSSKNGNGTISTPIFREVFDQYPQIIDFSGHTHSPENHPKMIYQDNFTMIGLGTLCNLECADEVTNGHIPSGSGTVGQFYIVEVNADNVVKIQPYNLIAEGFFKTPSNTDDPDATIAYYIPTTGNTDDFVYTSEYFDSLIAEPYFNDSAEISVSEITCDSALITVPQAYDDSLIYYYRMVYSDSDNIDHEVTFFSGFYSEPLPDSINYRVSDLTPNEEYRITIYPVNAWRIEGTPISTTFHTTAE